MTQDKHLSIKCRNILKEYEDILLHFIEEIKKETEGPINKITVDEIAMEYSKRQGMKQGALLLLQKITAYSNVKD